MLKRIGNCVDKHLISSSGETALEREIGGNWMILRCLCGASYSLKDEPVKLGESFECEECGGEVSVPALHGVVPTDGMVTLEDQLEEATRAPQAPVAAKPPGPKLSLPHGPGHVHDDAEVKSLLDRLEKLSRDNISLHLKVAELEKELAEPLSRTSKASQSNATQEQIDFGALRDEFFSGLKSLSSGLVELKQAWVTHADHKRHRDAHHESISEELTHTKDQVAKLRTLQKQIAIEKDTRIKELEKELEATRDELTRLTTSRSKQLKERDARIAKLEKTLEATRKEIVGLVSDRDEQVSTLEQQLATRSGQLKGMLLGLVEQLDDSGELGKTSAIEIADARDRQIAALQTMLRAFNRSVESTAKLNHHLLASSSSVGSDLQKLTEALEDLTEKVEALSPAHSHGPKLA